MPSGRDIVITGAGLVSPLGLGVARNWERVKRLETGITCAEVDGPSWFGCRGAVTEFAALQDTPAHLRGQIKFLNRGSLLGFEAAREAFVGAGADLADVPQGRRALYIASGDNTQVDCAFIHEALKDATGGLWEKIDGAKLNEAALSKVNPFFLLESILNNLFSALSAFLECMGPNTTLASESPCGASALERAARSIQDGSADVAFAVGCGNWISEVPMHEMAGLGLLSRGGEGARSFRPYDRRRDGFIPGEGGAALFLETAERAERRGAKILGRLLGIGGALVRPEAAAAGMRIAMEEAGLDKDAYAFVCGHGSGSPEGDRDELRSVMRVFGEGSVIPVCGLKAYTGHLGAASDIGEIILSMKALAEGVVPATLHFGEAEEEFGSLGIRSAHGTTDRKVCIAVTNGVSGQASAAVLEVPE